MSSIKISDFSIYRWRYWLGYSIIGLLLIGLLIFAGLYTPGGISAAEIDSVVRSATISTSSLSHLTITDLPFHGLQHLSLLVFGVSDFSIKLPSLILALVSAVGLILLLRRWFQPNVAVLASLIAISTGQFLFIAQNGTPSIAYIVWPVSLLLLGTFVSKSVKPQKLWIFLFFAIAAISLYTPLDIYALLALGAAAIFHPHLRFLIRNLSRKTLAGAFVLGLALTLPLIISIIKTPELGLNILGIPASWPNISANLSSLANQYFNFTTPSSTGLMTPVFGLGSMLIIGIGTYRLIRTRDSSQSYLIIIWLVGLLPMLLIRPDMSSITFLPLVLLLAAGLSEIMSDWYGLFPRNPYARVIGLVPLTILVGALIFSGLDRYVYGYQYDPQTNTNFSRDLSLLPPGTKNLVVVADQLDFYKVMQHYNKNLDVSLIPISNQFVATRAAKQDFTGYGVERIITSSTYQSGDRFYVYKKLSN